MKTAEIKRRYLAHFEANGHTVVPRAPLPAIVDFTRAGDPAPRDEAYRFPGPVASRG